MSKWEEVKNYVKGIKDEPRNLVDQVMKESPDKVKYIREEGKKFWEIPFMKNGYEGFIQYQEGGGKRTYKILLFDNKKGICFIRRPFEERDAIDIALGI